jgi:hypothetical protein
MGATEGAERCCPEAFTVLIMSDEAFGSFERYVVTSPPFCT